MLFTAAVLLPPLSLIGYPSPPSGEKILLDGLSMQRRNSSSPTCSYNSYLCYSHVLRALSPEVIATVRDYVRTITPETPDAYSTLKNVLITRFSPTQIDNCFKLLDMPPIGDRQPLAYHSDIMALLPTDGYLLVNAVFLRGLPEAIRAALAAKAELPPFELAQAAAQLPRYTAAQAPVSVNAAPAAAPSPPPMAANAPSFVP
jgi:hypothetical protein